MKRSQIHNNATRKYKEHFIMNNDYVYCEQCGVNENGTMGFSVHHIYFASRVPRHKELHNFRNLIYVCMECHIKFHAGDTYKKEFEQLERERGLKELFKSSKIGEI